MRKICPECGNSFECMGENDCWCEEVPVLKKEMMIIMNSFDDCLCPGCLGKYAES